MPAIATSDAVQAARYHFARARTMQRNRRLGAYQGRNSGGDDSRHMRDAATLAAEAGRELEGLLWAEHRLAQRLSWARDHDQARPELSERMTALRARIRQLAGAEGLLRQLEPEPRALPTHRIGPGDGFDATGISD